MNKAMKVVLGDTISINIKNRSDVVLCDFWTNNVIVC